MILLAEVDFDSVIELKWEIMQLMVRKISILILVVFGFNLVAEVVSAHFQSPDLYISTSSASAASDDSDSYMAGKSQSQDLNSEHKGCMDPCHRGQCHFGHCAYHGASGYSALSADLFKLGYINCDFLVPKSPFLEGPKRPPRLA